MKKCRNKSSSEGLGNTASKGFYGKTIAKNKGC